jgi:hypothetical protein
MINQLRSYTILALVTVFLVGSGCGIYKFKDVSFPENVKTFKVNPIENKAPYINTQLSPQLTDKLRRKIISQTKLTQTNGDNPDWEITGSITDYSFTTSGISNQQTSSNRLNVTIHITRADLKNGDTKEYNITRNFDFPANQSIQQAENSLLTDMIRGLSDDIFNQLFSTW